MTIDFLDLITRLDAVVSAAIDRLAAATAEGDTVSIDQLETHQEAAYHLAFMAAETEAVRALGAASAREAGSVDVVAVAELVASILDRMAGRPGLNPIDGRGRLEEVVAAGRHPDLLAAAAATLARSGIDDRNDLPSELALVAETFGRFADEVIAPTAEAVHRHNLDVPDDVITGLARLGAFGMSIPDRYGGFADEGVGAGGMVVATRELSRRSLTAGSLLTRPEILVAALLGGGTEAQRNRWLPAVASGASMVSVAVTEPDHGSDVAAIRTTATPADGGYRLHGTKMWATFAGRAELLTVLARTNPDRSAGHRGLSLFVVEKPPYPGHHFVVEQPGGGRLEGRAIDTIGYRGLHSFELVFENFFVPADALIGEADGAGRGFYLQMDGFAAGRLQTAARAVGVMEAAYGDALAHAARRSVFGRPLIEFPLAAATLVRMAARIRANRALLHRAADEWGSRRGAMMAAMAKALSARAAEEVTRDALQIHGGYGYAEEYAVSRYFLDARVLSIFEGTEEVLAIRVIARALIEEALSG